MDQKVVATEYMRRFRCIGADCEDTCCQGWRVNLPQEDYNKIRQLGDDTGNPLFNEALSLQPDDERQPHNWGYLDHGDYGRCPLMDHGWCLLHRDHGEKALPVVCATFPRLILPREGRLEMHGRLSCPEVARLTLPAENPVQTAPFEGELPGIFEIQLRLDDENGFYQRDLETLTKAVMTLLALDSYSLVQRLYFVTYLLKRVDGFVKLNTETDTAERLARNIKRMQDPKFLARIAGDATKNSDIPDQIGNYLISVIRAELHGPQHGRYNGLSFAAMAHLSQVAGSEEPAAMFAAYRASEQRIMAVHGPRIDRYLNNFSRVYWACYLYMGDTDVTTPLHKFLIYLAGIRILFFSDPRLQEPETYDHEKLDAVIVEVVQIYMKTIDANRELLKPILGSMTALNLTKVNDLAAFLQV